MNRIIRKIVNAFEPSVFDIDVQKQKAYISKLGEANNDFERSYYQYKCQMFLLNKAVRLIYNCLALALLIILRFTSWDEPERNEQEKRSLLLFSGNPNITPNEVVQEFGKPYQVVNWQSKHYLSKQDREFVRNALSKCRFSFYFKLKCILKISTYSYWIESFLPKSVVVASEYSFTSSLLTSYCNYRGVKHINVMHGEKLYYIRDSYFHFNACYIWDKYYKKLFCDMYAEPAQFIVAIPPKLAHQTSLLKESKTIDYTYYLGGEKSKQINKIALTLMKLKRNNMVVALRPHPIYTSMKAVQKYSDYLVIEKTSEMTIGESLARTKHVIALYSTVLQEAKLYGDEVVIDDITEPCRYSQLKKLRYKLIEEQHSILSDEIPQ